MEYLDYSYAATTKSGLYVCTSLGICFREPEWITVCAACEYASPKCDTHLQRLEQISSQRPGTIYCPRCGVYDRGFDTYVF